MQDIRRLDCQFGSHYYKEKQSGQSSRVCLQGTRKIGCKAHIVVRSLVLFTDYCITDKEKNTLSARGLKELKQTKIQTLRQTLTKGEKVNQVTKYHLLLPTEQAHHSFHPTHGPASYAQRTHPKLIEKIYELVTEGITEVQEVKRALKHHVLHVLCPETKPELTDRAYFPTTVDVRNHIYKAQRACQLSKLDQENLKLKVEQWRKDSPGSSFFFCPYKEAEEENGGTKESFEQNLLYVHQEPWQKDLLNRYGNTISLMDATYKTTKYELALFFVAVKTNVGYSAVVDFVLQSETTDQIIEALKILSSWNKDWRPPYFMTDYSEAEISAINTVFPTCKVYLCDFHREQSWERWVKELKHGLTSEEGDLLLSFLRDLAQAPSPTSDELPIDHHYHYHLQKLKDSEIWQKKTCVREWLKGKWLCSPEVHVYNYSHLFAHSDSYIFTGQQGIYMNIQVYNYTNSYYQ